MRTWFHPAARYTTMQKWQVQVVWRCRGFFIKYPDPGRICLKIFVTVWQVKHVFTYKLPWTCRWKICLLTVSVFLSTKCDFALHCIPMELLAASIFRNGLRWELLGWEKDNVLKHSRTIIYSGPHGLLLLSARYCTHASLLLFTGPLWKWSVVNCKNIHPRRGKGIAISISSKEKIYSREFPLRKQ